MFIVIKDINTLFINLLLQEGVHAAMATNDVDRTIKKLLQILLQLNKQIEIGSHIHTYVNVTQLHLLVSCHRAEDAQRLYAEVGAKPFGVGAQKM